jgi:hypothetical protein
MTREDKIAAMLGSNQEELKALGETLKKEEELKKKISLPLVREMQEKWPEVIISGSVALYLHGLKLKRWHDNVVVDNRDLDILIPHYVPFDEDERFRFENWITGSSPIPGSNGMCCVWSVNGLKIDTIICPQQGWEFIELDGFKYKVARLEGILWAKMAYIWQGKIKHLYDIYELVGKRSQRDIDREEEEEKQRQLEEQRKRRSWGGS